MPHSHPLKLRVRSSNQWIARSPSLPGDDWPVKQVCKALGIACLNAALKRARPPDGREKRTARQTDDASPLKAIRYVIADLPSDGYRRA
ncbi:putative transposase [Ralstonia solanacearum K60]|nr:putative transposase [Ralstonia solanacearum K60]